MAVIIIEQSSNYSEFLSEALSQAGVATRVSEDAASIVAADAILILVGSDASECMPFIAELRVRHPSTLQMVVSDCDDVGFRIAAYEAGADDCMSRPFHLRELVAKLRAMKRRASQGFAIPLLPAATALIDVMALELRIGDRARRVTKREADLLLSLCRAAGDVVRREDVLRDAWGASAGVTGNLVDVYVGYARRKLDEIAADVAIKSVRGEGFRLVECARKRGKSQMEFDESCNIPARTAL